MLETYDAEEVEVTRLRDGRILFAAATWADGETDVLDHGSLRDHLREPMHRSTSRRSRPAET
jgi:hypothetical protein